MPDLKKKFSRSDWKDCCGKGCKKCEIAQAYVTEYGRKEGLEKLNADRKAVKKGGKTKGSKAKKKAKV